MVVLKRFTFNFSGKFDRQTCNLRAIQAIHFPIWKSFPPYLLMTHWGIHKQRQSANPEVEPGKVSGSSLVPVPGGGDCSLLHAHRGRDKGRSLFGAGAPQWPSASAGHLAAPRKTLNSSLRLQGEIRSMSTWCSPADL